MPIFILSILIQLAIVIHIVKTGRNMMWIFIVVLVPVVGTLAYVIVELLPGFTGSRTARTAQRQLAKAINPDGALREAAEQYEAANTTQNAVALAEQYLLRSRFEEAKPLYQRALTGLHADDPDLLLGLAEAHFGLGEYTDALQCLDSLKQKNPDRTSQEGHLLYARTLVELGRVDEAVPEFESLVAYYPGPEPACRLAMILKSRGQPDRANELLRDVLKKSRFGGRHYNELNQEWIALARREAREA